jgi:NADH-quinone oxidoreductase subunit E
MVEAKRPETLTNGMMTVLPREMASAANLLVHPLTALAAASAANIGLASHAFGIWMGAMTGMAQASQRMFVPPASKDETAALVEKQRSPATKASKAARTLIDDVQSTALEIAGGSASPAASPAKADAGQSVELLPEDFRQPKSMAKPKKIDDLKAISGVGPKLETVLNGLGVWTFTQIAGWTEQEIAWVEDYLSFKGRIGRDNWIAQAAKLAGKKKR